MARGISPWKPVLLLAGEPRVVAVKNISTYLARQPRQDHGQVWKVGDVAWKWSFQLLYMCKSIPFAVGNGTAVPVYVPHKPACRSITKEKCRTLISLFPSPCAIGGVPERPPGAPGFWSLRKLSSLIFSISLCVYICLSLPATCLEIVSSSNRGGPSPI